MNKDKKYLEVIPVDRKKDVIYLLNNNFSFRERWEIAKAKAEAEGNVRMVIADFLIEEGLMKRVFKRRRG